MIFDRSIDSPLVMTSKAYLLEEIPANEIKGRYSKQFKINVDLGLQKIAKYRCQKSGYEFFFPYNLAGDSSFYEQLQRFDWYYMPWKWEHEQTLQLLKPDAKILEVGSGASGFVRALSEKGFDITGLELNKDAVRIAQMENLEVYVQAIL